MKRSYPTDLADAEWECLSSHVPAPNKRGRPRIHSSRVILDAIFFYVLRSGCPWRLLPREFPPWKTVHHYLLQDLAARWGMGAAKQGIARALAGTAGEKPTAQRRNGRFAIGRDEWGRWRTEGLRWRQEGPGPQATPARRYGRFGAQSQGTQRQGPRPRRDQVGSGGST
jgi:transposase